jgi:pyruvate,water dikinase
VAERRVREPSGSSIKDTTDEEPGTLTVFAASSPAVKALLSMAIRACRKHKKYVGICGQGPSDHPDLARWLMDQGIDSMSLNPDTVVATWRALAEPVRTPQSSAAA